MTRMVKFYKRWKINFICWDLEIIKLRKMKKLNVETFIKKHIIPQDYGIFVLFSKQSDFGQLSTVRS